jgi:hypothetical protein
VSHAFDMSADGILRPPKATATVAGRGIYLWTVPILPQPAFAR